MRFALGVRWRRLAVVAATAAATTVGFGAAASAQPGVDPADVSREADPGTSFVIDKLVSTPAIPPTPDVVLLVDETGSMGGVIANVQANLDAVVAEVRAAQPTAQFAVASFKDTTNADCDPDFFVVHQDLTDDQVAVQNAVDGLIADGGCDYPEDWLYALHEIATGAISFRPDSSRIVVLVGDAPSHDPSNGIDLTTAVDAMLAAAIRVIAVNVDTFGAGLDDFGQAAAVTDATGGALTLSEVDDVTDAILGALEQLEVTVEPEAACEDGLSVTFDPAARTVAAGAEADFEETVAVAADATAGDPLVCTVEFRLNGASGGPEFVQTITVDVTGTPATTPPATTPPPVGDDPPVARDPVELPNTGASVALLVVLGVALLGGGAALLFLRKRRIPGH